MSDDYFIENNLACGKCGEPLEFEEGVNGPTWETTYEVYKCECGAKWRLYLLKDDDSNNEVFDVINKVCRRNIYD